MKSLKYIIIFIFSFLNLTGFSQTKLISFKSHSGNKINFRNAIEKNLFDMEKSNFGLVIKYTYIIDSVENKRGKIVVYKNVSHQNGQKIISRKNIDTLSLNDSKNFLKSKNKEEIKWKLKKKFKTYTTDSLKLIGFKLGN